MVTTAQDPMVSIYLILSLMNKGMSILIEFAHLLWLVTAAQTRHTCVVCLFNAEQLFCHIL